MALINEIKALNAQLHLFLGPGRILQPFIEDVTEEAVLNMFNKQVFGRGDGPLPLAERDRYVVIILNQTRVTKEEARTMILRIVDSAVKGLTLSPPNDNPSQIKKYEAQLRGWLQSTEHIEEPFPSQRAIGPLLVSLPAVPLEESEHPATFVYGNQESTTQPVHSQPQSSIAQHPDEPRATYISNVPVEAPQPQPQSNQHPAIMQPLLPLPQQAPPPPLPYHLQGPPIQWYAPFPGQIQPFGPQLLPYYGPLMGVPIFAPPRPIQRPPTQQAVVVMPRNPPATSRSSLPPARRQSSQSAWAPGRRRFNVAEWAQEHRPRTPPVSTAAQAPHTTTSSATAPVTPRYGQNGDTMYPKTTGEASQQFRTLNQTHTPNYTTITNDSTFPFEVPATTTGPAAGGVIRISNTPYGLKRADVASFLGAHTSFATPNAVASIHIMMDRMSGKTYDCYVEIQGVASAQAIVNLRNSLGHTQPLLDRNPVVSMSSLDQLLADMFPKARAIQWASGQPSLRPGETNDSSHKALITPEEMTTTVRYAETPTRTQFIGQKCPQRVYEFMISTLAKFPWYATNAYTIGTRNQIFAAVRDLLQILVTQADLGRNPDLNEALVSELLYAGLNCPGFSERQRWELARAAGPPVGLAARVSPLAKHWPFMVLGRKPNVPEDVMEYYIDLLTRHLDIPSAKPTMNPFRSLLLPPNRGEAALAGEQGSLELQGVLDIYRMTLPQ